MEAVASNTTIFGGNLGWNAEDWTSSDDRVRGGMSQSYLKITQDYATFCGNLDIETLGGAGFASQRTTGEDRTWDLSEFSGIEIQYIPEKTDNKKYTFVLKDELLPPDDTTGREQSSVSWEYDFRKVDTDTINSDRTGLVVIQWEDFAPTYRGRPKKDAEPLRKDHIKRMSFMMRSFFGTQHGEFELAVLSVQGIPLPKVDDRGSETRSVTDNDSHYSLEKLQPYNETPRAHGKGLLASIMSCLRL